MRKGARPLEDILEQNELEGVVSAIIYQNEENGYTILRMDVPCCGGMENAVRSALAKSGKAIPCTVDVIGRDGKRLKSESLQMGGAPLLRKL